MAAHKDRLDRPSSDVESMTRNGDTMRNGFRSRSHKKPVRVLLTTPSMSRHGGVSQYWRTLRPHLCEDVQYFTVGSRSDKNSFAVPLRLVQDSWKFADTLRRGGFDIVHLNPSMFSKALIRDGLLLLLAKALGKEVLVFAHGWNPAWTAQRPKYFTYAFRVVFGRADAFVVLGKRFEQQLRLLGYKNRVFIHGAPVSDDLLKAAGNEPPAHLPVADPKFNILFLARVERDKGIYEALDAFWTLKQKYWFVSLTVAGDGAELNAARRYASDHHLTDVTFLGHVDGVERVDVFRAADAYLFPSHHEGLPLSVLEAITLGVPVVTCDVGALRDFFEDGRMGFISTGREPKILASLLSRLVSDPKLCSTIREFNRKYAAAHFTAHQVALRLQKIYSDMLGFCDDALSGTK
jgi:glycosyltransferase involved in cell wall biosynthesis